MSEEKKKNDNQRYRQFSCITYHDLETVKSVLNVYSSCIKHYAGIVHDKDYKEDGTLKEKHIHLIISFYNARTISAVRKLFPDNQNTLAQSVHDIVSCFEYLTHENEDEKVRYDESAIFADDLDYWKRISTVGERDDKTLSILEDIIKKVRLRDMVLRYGRDFVINMAKYYQFARMLEKDDDYFNGVYEENNNNNSSVGLTLTDIETGEVVLEVQKK